MRQPRATISRSATAVRCEFRVVGDRFTKLVEDCSYEAIPASPALTLVLLAVLAVGAIATPLSAAPIGAATSRPLVCASKGFMETIRSGPDHGVAVKGELVFERVPSGATGGALTTVRGLSPSRAPSTGAP